MKKIIAVSVNDEDGYLVEVGKTDRGYSVAVKDTDVNQYLPTVLVYKSKSEAIKRAREIAKGVD